MHHFSYNLFYPEILEPMNTLQMKTCDIHFKINKQARSQLEHHQPGAWPEETGMIREPWRQMEEDKIKNGKDKQEKKSFQPKVIKDHPRGNTNKTHFTLGILVSFSVWKLIKSTDRMMRGKTHDILEWYAPSFPLLKIFCKKYLREVSLNALCNFPIEFIVLDHKNIQMMMHHFVLKVHNAEPSQYLKVSSWFSSASAPLTSFLKGVVAWCKWNIGQQDYISAFPTPFFHSLSLISILGFNPINQVSSMPWFSHLENIDEIQGQKLCGWISVESLPN